MQPANINDMTVTELESLAWRIFTQRETLTQNLVSITQLIAEKSKVNQDSALPIDEKSAKKVKG